MNKKQAIAEAEHRFEIWWKAEGFESAFYNIAGSPKLEDVKELCEETWMNGAFVTKENN